MKKAIQKLLSSQLEEWKLARENYQDLEKVESRKVILNDGTALQLQFNPARIISTSAKVDAKSLAKRPCFLCEQNRPKEQRGIAIADNFLILVNPFPILREHFTIVNTAHTPQQIEDCFSDFLLIAKKFGAEFSVFYNGAKCGASAPDHLHFQAGNTNQFPIWEFLKNENTQILYQKETVEICSFEGYVKALLLSGNSATELDVIFRKTLHFLADVQKNTDEPMLNILAKYENGWQVLLFPREQHRPTQYFAEGNEQILLSPATVDFGGLVAVPRKCDFEHLDAILLQNIFSQLTYNSAHFNQLKDQIRQL